MMPLNLVLARHMESDANRARRDQKGGKSPPEGLLATPDWQMRGTKRGRKDAKETGLWIKSYLGIDPHVGIVSAHVRARETAGHLGLGLDWNVSLRLVERDYGRHDLSSIEDQVQDRLWRDADPLFHRMGLGTGQSLVEVADSSLWFFDTLHREHSDSNVIAVCHGERMWDIQREIEKWTPEEFAAKMNDKAYEIYNCHLVHYTRVNPFAPEENPHHNLKWVRRVCPCKKKGGKILDSGWQEIIRRKYSDDDLLDVVSKYRSFFD